jgi:LmbE family N-acetylglucosaminyl deacetylase
MGKKRKRFLLIICYFSLLMFWHCKVEAKVAVWYLPHPDDETIGMADAIHTSVQNHINNYIIYFTKGGASQARHFLRGVDGKKYHLTKEELEQARINETLAALQVLGVGPENVLFFNFSEGNIPLQAAIKIISLYVNLFPDAIHSTVSYHDPHEDHKILAQALSAVNEIYKNRLTVRYYHVYIYNQKGPLPKNVATVSVKSPEIKRKAIDEYYKWEPTNGRYAVGAHSTPKLFEHAKTAEYEYIDMRSTTYRSMSKPASFRLFLNGLGLTYQITHRFSFGLDWEFNKQFYSSPRVEFSFPDRIPFIQTKGGMGFCGQNNLWHWLMGMELLDNYFCEYNFFCSGGGQIKLGVVSKW